MKSLLLIPLLLTGCAIQKYNKPPDWASAVTHKDRGTGIKIGYQGYSLFFGWWSSSTQIIPVSKQKIYAATVSDTFSLGVDGNPFNTTIKEDFQSGWESDHVPVPRLRVFNGPDDLPIVPRSREGRWDNPEPSEVEVYFSPNGGCTEAIVREIDRATNQILVQAYNFTSELIGDALAQAARRGVTVVEIQDNVAAHQKNFQGPKLIEAGGSVFIDKKHSIAHNKVIVVDGATLITGSFNFSKNAENRNAENLLVINNGELAGQYSENWSNHLSHSTPYKP